MIVLEPQRRNSKEVPAHLLLGYEKVLSEADVSLLATWSCPGSVDTLASAFRAPSQLEVMPAGSNDKLVVACRCESGPGSCQEAR